ncbi:MAG: hypothetical protein IJF44_00435 [Clostridia bacterium]|nr:hypothetical protein [Clostridia bacterium]
MKRKRLFLLALFFVCAVGLLIATTGVAEDIRAPLPNTKSVRILPRARRYFAPYVLR